MYQLTPPNIRNNPMPYFKLQEWGLEQSMIDAIEDQINVQPAKYITDNGKDDDTSIRSTDIDWIDTRMQPDFYALLGNVVHYANNTLFKYAITDLEPCQYGVYDANKKGHYDTHSDGAFKGQHGQVRKISFSILLSDPKDFEGGELLLMPDFQGIKTDLQKHEICFFPSWLPHKVTPVTKGIRKSIVGWVHGPDFV